MKRLVLAMGVLLSTMAWGQHNGKEMSDSVACDTTGTAKMETLREIVVKGNLPNTRIKGNAMVTKVEGTALAESGTANEMLCKVPGMTGDGESLSVLGKGSPVIFINGRQLRDMSELKRLRSEDVKDVEVVNNPGAQYDATVRAVVRIRTKRIQGDGFGFNLTLRDDHDLRYGFSTPNNKLSMNYRKGAVDVFGSVWYWHQDYRQYSTLEETSYTGKTFRQYGPYTMTWKHDGLTYTGGANWQIKDNHSVGFRADLTTQYGGKNKVIYDEDIFVDGTKAMHLYSEQTNKESKPLAWLTNAYYSGKAGKLGIDLNFDFLKSETNTDRENLEITDWQNDVVKSGSGADNNLYATKLVLSYPVWNGTLEAGTEMSFVNRHNTYWIDKQSIANTDADIKENSFASFAEYDTYIGTQSSASVGLRYEHTLLDYDDKLGTDDLRRITDDLFPSASFATTLGNVQMGLSYSIKTNRPSYFALNDAVTYISRYSLQAGNSRLRNEILHDLTFNAAWKWLTLTASFNRCKHPITQWSYLQDSGAGDGSHMVLIKHVNLDRPINTYSAYIGATPSVGIWSLSATVGFTKQDFYLDLEDANAEGGLRREYFNKPVFECNAFNTFSFKHDWQVDVNFMFTSKGHQQNFYNDYNCARLGIVLQKKLLPNKALTLRAAVVDILQRNRTNEYGDFGYYKIQQNNRYSKHKLVLMLSYNFNSARSKYKGTGAGKEAQQRMKS